jgi:DNA modification methylase
MQSDSERLVPSQTNLLQPLLHELFAAGGCARPGELYDRIAARLGLDDAARNATVIAGRAGPVNAYERQVRWTRQTAVCKGLIAGEQRGRWELTDRANAKLGQIVRGAIVTIFETDRGCMLWANAEDAVGLLEPHSIDLLLSSPPYPLLRPKPYQLREDRDAMRWVSWMMRLAEQWRELLTPTGSMMINVGPVWMPGEPRQSTFIERFLIALEDHLGLYLCQRLRYESPTKLPSPLEWVGVRRIRVKETTEPILWVSPNPSLVAADNRRVLRPYTKSGRRSIARPEDGTRKRPSGFSFGPSSFKDNGGAIPPATIVSRGVGRDAGYRQAERAAGRVPHPATMPEDVAAFCISLATAPKDLVYDPFGGSGTTGVAAERLDRRWIMSERSREYVESARIRFESNGFSPRLLSAV